MKRFLTAFRFNEPQANAVLLFSALNAVALSQSVSQPIWLWAVALLFWPASAVLANLILGPTQ